MSDENVTIELRNSTKEIHFEVSQDSTSTEIKVDVYENGDDEPTWAKEFVVD